MAKQKKRFLDSIGAALRENIVEEVVLEQKMLPKKKIGFLDRLVGEELDVNTFQELMPQREISKPTPKKKLGSLTLNKQNFIHYSTEIATQTLEKIRDIADAGKMNIQDVINLALTQYVDSNWHTSMESDK
jgi:hypothetical protein